MTQVKPPKDVELKLFVPQMYPQVERNITEFAEEEVTLPAGPRKAMKFDAAYMPFMRFILDAIDDGYYRVVSIVGCTQTGKSLVGTNIPLLYFLFEKKEPVIYGVPMMDLAHGVWTDKIQPVLAGTKYNRLMPTTGTGSRGGNFNAVMLKNGVSLRFLGAGAGAAGQSSHTAKYILLTEVDKYDKVKGDEEADPVSLMMNRNDAFEDGKTIMECTVTTENGRIWQEAMVNGTGSRAYVPCPKCGEYQALVVDQLRYDATDGISAEETAMYECCKCEKLLSEDDRLEMLESPLLVHSGQEVQDGKVVGDVPRTRTFGFHYNVFYSPFQSLGKTAAQKREADISPLRNIKKGFQQSKLALPWKEEGRTENILSANYLKRRSEASECDLKVLPDWADDMVMTVDVQKGWIYWHVDAWGPMQQSQVVEYGSIDIIGDPKRGLVKALDEAEEYAIGGWTTENGKVTMQPILRLVDIGYRYDIISGWLMKNKKWRGVKGYGKGQKELLKTKSLYEIPGILDIRQHKDGNQIWFIYVDETKGIVHDRYFSEYGQPGYTHVPREITQSYMMQMAAEKREYLDDNSDDYVWKKIRRRNDYLDCRSYSVAGQMFLFIKKDEIEKKKEQAKARKGVQNKKRLSGTRSGSFLNSKGRYYG